VSHTGSINGTIKPLSTLHWTKFLQCRSHLFDSHLIFDHSSLRFAMSLPILSLQKPLTLTFGRFGNLNTSSLVKSQFPCSLECSEKDQNCKLQFPQPDYWPRHSPDFRTVFGIMSEQVSDFRFGHRKWPFWEWEKATFTAFPHSRKGPSGAQNENLRPVLTLGLWRGNVVSNLLTFGHWKVVFLLFLILYRAFSHFMYLTFCQFCNRKMVQSWFRKLFWNQDCDVLGNLVVEIEIFNFCLFVCLLVCLYLTFCQFRKRKMVQS